MKRATVFVAALLILSAVTPAASGLEVRRSGRPCWFEVALRLGDGGTSCCCGIGSATATQGSGLTVLSVGSEGLVGSLLRAARFAGAASAVVGPAGAVRERLEQLFGSRESGVRAD